MNLVCCVGSDNGRKRYDGIIHIKPLLQQRQALLQFLRSQDERDAHEPRTNVEIIHSRTGPADEGSLRDGSGERLDDEVLDAVPEGIGGGKSALFGIVGSSAVENSVRA